MTYFPRIENEESIKYYTFLVYTYPNRGNKINGGWGGLLWWVVPDGVGPQGSEPHDLFGGVVCTIKILMGGRGG